MTALVENAQLAALLANVEEMKSQYQIEVSPSIEFRATADAGVGIFANSPIQPAECIVQVPFASVICTEAILNHPALSPLFTDYPVLLDYPDEILAIGLLYALNHDCPWSLHVSTMPRSFNTPLYWTEEELSYLSGNNVYHLTVMLHRQIQADFTGLHMVLIENYPDLLGQIGLEEYYWALSIIYSRALDITRQHQATRIIVPVLDMANHNYYSNDHTILSPRDTFEYNEEKDVVQFKAGYAISPGGECYAVYGNYCNAKLLHTYGFVCLHNPYQCIDVWTKLLPTNAFFEQKNALLQRFHLSTDGHTYDFNGTISNLSPKVSSKLLQMIRIIQCADEEELQGGEELLGGRTGARAMVSVRNERAVYESLISLLSARLQPGIAEAERRELGGLLLNDTPLHHRRALSLVVKTQERELLQETIALVTGWIEALEREGESFRPVDAPKKASDFP